MGKMSDETKGKIIGGIVGLMAIGGILMFVYGFVFGGKGIGAGGTSEGAIIATAKHYVKQELKSPSTAQFCPQNEIKIYEASDGIVVSGYVDAENSFGAKIRNNFSVNLTSDGKKLKDVKFY